MSARIAGDSRLLIRLETAEQARSSPVRLEMFSGVMQVNVRIPANAPTGSSVPIVITVGSAATQTNITLAVQ